MTASDIPARMAHEAFPWAGIDTAYTLPGFLTLRASRAREAWGRVLAGSDDQLTAAFAALIAPGAGLDLDAEMIAPFVARMIMVGRTDELARWIVGFFYPDVRPQADIAMAASFFAEGFRAATGKGRAQDHQRSQRELPRHDSAKATAPAASPGSCGGDT